MTVNTIPNYLPKEINLVMFTDPDTRVIEKLVTAINENKQRAMSELIEDSIVAAIIGAQLAQLVSLTQLKSDISDCVAEYVEENCAGINKYLSFSRLEHANYNWIITYINDLRVTKGKFGNEIRDAVNKYNDKLDEFNKHCNSGADLFNSDSAQKLKDTIDSRNNLRDIVYDIIGPAKLLLK